MESNTINQELLKEFDFSCNTPSASAFCQQRGKLKMDAFTHLLRTFNSHFPLKIYKEKYTLIACDGSEFNIPRNPADTSTFNPPNKTALQGFNMMHTVSFYDVLGKRYLDVVVQPGREKDEFRALCELTDRYSYGGSPIILADRGFASYNVFAHASNFAQAMKICITFLRWSANASPLNIEGLIGKYILPVRPDRNYARQHRIQHPASFAYRFQ
ncbi:DDE family transposase [Mobilisporobacter senegalensis]|uniref:DDE family transposase n=1 Tax=Mobilisporobacter senegalensis TaxID=1329262 RepID=A0A3N1XCM7_9FIRM|nr:transposase [Mobilisporobacter senegalensis]ROR23881.1 DDE family transposase [Mobilisporobacter senegalensis]